MKRHEEEMDHVWKTFRPDAAAKRNSLFGKTDGSSNSIVEWINRRESTCFICNSVKNTFQAYMKTFFSMYKRYGFPCTGGKYQRILPRSL